MIDSHATTTHLTPVDKNLAAWIALLLFGLYMLTFDGTLHSTDGLSMLAVAENLVKHGRFDTRQLENWESARIGLDGAPHTVFPIGPTLWMLPLYALALALPYIGLTQTTMTAMPLFSALTAIYTYLSARRLGYAPKVGLTVTLLAGLATMTWPRMRDLVADPLTLFTLTAAFYYALAYRQDKRLSQAGLMGLTLGLTLLNKTVNVVILPLFFGYLLYADLDRAQRSWRAIKWRPVLIAALPVVIAMLIVLGYNAVRFGNPFDSGYRDPYTVLLRTPIWVGFIGVIISPYKSLFLYIPLFILIPLALKSMWHKHPTELLLIAALLLSYMVAYGAFYDWGGGRNWGPRYLAPLNALLTLLLLPLIDRAFQPRHWPVRLALMGIGLLSVAMQILGISARDYAFLDAADYWTPPPNLSFWGELRRNQPDQWPIWGHWLRFDLANIPVIWRWQWAGLNHFDPLALLAALLIVVLGLAGVIAVYRFQKDFKLWLAAAWLVALGSVALILARSYDDPRSIKDEAEAGDLWPAYQTLVTQLPGLVSPTDALVFTDRRFEFYLLDTDKSLAQRYIVSKPSQPDLLEAIPRLLQQARPGRIWLVTDDLDNRQLAYATELWLRAHGALTTSYVFGESVRLTKFEPLASPTPWDSLPAEPRLAGLVDPNDYKFNGIAALLGWNWPDLEPATPPTLQAGQSYAFELFWIYQGKAPDDKFFARLLNPVGRPVVEAWLSSSASDKLTPGQLVIEPTRLSLPADLPAGLYHLQLGFSTPAVEAGELIFDLPAEMTEIQISH